MMPRGRKKRRKEQLRSLRRRKRLISKIKRSRLSSRHCKRWQTRAWKAGEVVEGMDLTHRTRKATRSSKSSIRRWSRFQGRNCCRVWCFASRELTVKTSLSNWMRVWSSLPAKRRAKSNNSWRLYSSGWMSKINSYPKFRISSRCW